MTLNISVRVSVATLVDRRFRTFPSQTLFISVFYNGFYMDYTAGTKEIKHECKQHLCNTNVIMCSQTPNAFQTLVLEKTLLKVEF